MALQNKQNFLDSLGLAKIQNYTPEQITANLNRSNQIIASFALEGDVLPDWLQLSHILEARGELSKFDTARAATNIKTKTFLKELTRKIINAGYQIKDLYDEQA